MPKACSIVLRGASKDVLNEIERNLHDAMGVARNVVRDPRLVPGGGACEMAVSRGLKDRSAAIEGVGTSAETAIASRYVMHVHVLQHLCIHLEQALGLQVLSSGHTRRWLWRWRSSHGR